MRKAKKIYDEWVEETESEENRHRLKQHPLYRDLRAMLKEHPEYKEPFIDVMIKELGNEELQSVHQLIVLKFLNKKDIVPKQFRGNFEEEIDFWVFWYTDRIVQENWFV